ncbi:MAG: hypothetical protein ACXVAG_19075 [Vulcanimicrobiaceae bacterium]
MRGPVLSLLLTELSGALSQFISQLRCRAHRWICETVAWQTLELHALSGDAAREDSAVGTRVLEGRTGEPASDGDTRIWAGRIADSFYIDLSLLGIVNGAVKNGTAVDLAAWHPEKTQNSFANTTVESIAHAICGLWALWICSLGSCNRIAFTAAFAFTASASPKLRHAEPVEA